MRVSFINDLDSSAMWNELDAASVIKRTCLYERIKGGIQQPSFGHEVLLSSQRYEITINDLQPGTTKFDPKVLTFRVLLSRTSSLRVVSSLGSV